jgi:hypothetical protein
MPNTKQLSINFDIDVDQLIKSLIVQIPTSGSETIVTLIRNLVIEQLETKLESFVVSGEILRFKVKALREPFPNSRYKPSLKELTNEKTVDLGYICVIIVTSLAKILHLQQPRNLLWEVPPEVKRQSLKTVEKSTVRMRSVAINSSLLESVSNKLVSGCRCEPDSLAPYIYGVWDWTLRFICKICGKSYFCECFRKALDLHYPKALAEKPRYGEGGWPHKFLTAFKQSDFKEGICHLCRDMTSELFYCHPMYGSKVRVHYGPYIVRTSIEKGISQREAENEIRNSLGIPHISEGWVSEVELLNIVREIFPNEKVIHQVSPEWLGLQRLDIYIPKLKLAIEYQGRQHYEPVPFFGGEEAFSLTQERDKRKSNLCSENDITLIYFRYDEEISLKMVERRLRSALVSRE